MAGVEIEVTSSTEVNSHTCMHILRCKYSGGVSGITWARFAIAHAEWLKLQYARRYSRHVEENL